MGMCLAPDKNELTFRKSSGASRPGWEAGPHVLGCCVWDVLMCSDPLDLFLPDFLSGLEVVLDLLFVRVRGSRLL